MKKINVLLLAIALFNLAACGKSDVEKQDEQKKAALTHFKATPMPDPKNYKNPEF